MNKYQNILKESLKDSYDWKSFKNKLSKHNTSKSELTKKKSLAGKAFEYFSKYYFLSHPDFNDEFDQVYLYEEIPPEILEKYKLPSTDHGIDLLLIDRYKKAIAVQCKFRNDENSSLSWSKDKIANLFASGLNCDYYMLFTNASKITKVASNLTSKFSLVSIANLLSLSKEDFQRLTAIANSIQPKEVTKFLPHNHQLEAINAVCHEFKKHDRTQLVLPCGAGKTLTSLWIKEKLNSRCTLLLVPSLALIRQIKSEWLRHKSKKFEYLCVCSEKDIDKGGFDIPRIEDYEVGTNVSTDPIIINRFLGKQGNRVIFSTYQSLSAIEVAIKTLKGFAFDLAICDEAHKTSGGKLNNTFTLIHDNERIKCSHRLYMTATPRILSTKLKSKLDKTEFKLIADMGNENIFGKEAFRLSFGEAIDRKILVDYKIIGVGVTDKQIQNYIEERNYIGTETVEDVAHNFALEYVMNKYQATHALTFHSTVIKAKKFSERHKFSFQQTYSNFVSGEVPTSIRSKILSEFKAKPKGVISNARCLTEGVDVPTIDLIYFCDPKNSKIDIVQATGRALRKSNSRHKEYGYIVIPIYHHEEEDIDEKILKKPIFNYLVQVVRSLGDQDERLDAEIQEIAYGKGKRKTSKINFEYIPEEDEISFIKLDRLQKKLKETLFDEIITRTKSNWSLKYLELKEFIKTNGNMEVSRSGNRKLANWIYEQRRANRLKRIDPIKKKKLTELKFEWGESEFKSKVTPHESFMKQYDQLKEFHRKRGHSRYMKKYGNPTLYHWTLRVRGDWKKGVLEKKYIKLLKEINFPFSTEKLGPSPKDDNWFERLLELRDFKEKYGHANVSQVDPEYWSLGLWLNDQRAQKKGRKHGKDLRFLSQERIDLLDELNIEWDRRKSQWKDKLNLLKQHKEKYGHFNARQSDQEFSSLYYLLRKFKISGVDLDQLIDLKGIGFDIGGLIVK